MAAAPIKHESSNNLARFPVHGRGHQGKRGGWLKILRAVQEPTFSQIAVTSCTSHFLVVRLERGWQPQMGDESYVGLVDPHPERHRGRNHANLVPAEGLLYFRAHVAGQPCVIGAGT